MKKIFILILISVTIQIQAFCSDFTYKKLNSGQTVIIKEIKDNPIVTVNTWIKTGSVNENEENNGVAHFLEHLFFKGSKNVPTGEFDKILESKGAVTNAATSRDYTQFYITIPSSDFDLALKLHSDMLLHPLIPQAELEKERHVVIEEISRGLDNPYNIVYNNLFKLVYSTNNNHPYKRPIIGTKEIISNISRESILNFYDKWYTPSNMVTVIVGDVDSKYALQKVEEFFLQDKKPENEKSNPSINPIEKRIEITENKDIAQGYTTIAYKAPKFTDTKDAYALDILSVILGGASSSILNSELKEKKQLVSSISSAYVQYKDDGMFMVSAVFEPDKNLSVIQKEIFDEIDKVKQGAITKDEVQRAKNILKTSTDYSREQGANIAEELGYYALFTGSPKMYEDYLKKINAVNIQDVIFVANKYLDKNKIAISTLLPSGYKNISFENTASAAKIIPNSAEKIEATKQETKYFLDNDAVLIVRKNKSNSIVSVNIQAKGGAFLAEKPGLAYLTAANATRGTAKKSFEELQKYMDETGIKIGAQSGSDMFNISMKTTKDRLYEGLCLLDEIVNSSSFATFEIEKTKKNYKDYVKSLKDKSLSMALDTYVGLAYKNYPYANNSSVILKYIDEISREDIISYYNKILDPKNLVISVVGDVDDETLIKEFNKIFKDKGQKQVEIKNYIKSSYVPNENIVQKISLNGKETSWIVLGYKTGTIYDIKEFATLRVIDSILGTGMSSRMFKSLREDKGLAYQVGTQIQQFGADGSFYAYIGTNPKNEETAITGILEEFEKLKKEFVPKDELQEAKDKLLGNMILALETNSDRAFYLSKHTAYGFGLNYLEETKEAIKNVTSSDILSFANKYFSKPYFLIVAGN